MVTAAAGVAGYSSLAVAAQGPWDGLGYWLTLAAGAVTLAAGSLLAPRTPARAALVTLLVGGAAMRLVLVPVGPALSTDSYRYLWDGRVQAAGYNPYVHAPADDELAGLRDAQVWPHINRKPARTIYPPAAQAAFLAAELTGARTPVAWKALMAAAGGAGWAWGWFAVALYAAYVSIFHDQLLEPFTGGIRLSTPIRVTAAGAVALLALAAVRVRWCRSAVIWHPPDEPQFVRERVP